MTMPTAVPAVQTIELPPPGDVVLTRMVSDPLFPNTKSQVMACPHCKQNLSVPLPPPGKEEPITWIIGQPHPLVPEMKVIRMFLNRDGVEIYSVSNDGKAGMRNLVPMDSVRLTEEAMPLDIFAEELAAAEEDGDDPEPGDPGDPEPPGDPDPAPPQALVPVSNGQSPS
jgi:hypothetical protein